jgi:hypothetical protein
MNIESKPLHCTLVFEISVEDKKFNVNFYQDIETNNKVINVLNTDGTPLEDLSLFDEIVKYIKEKYDISYDPGTSENIDSSDL